jgi:MFS family permease
MFAAFLVNQTGFWVSHVSMQGLMVGLSHNQPIWLGLLFFFLFIPAFALAPLAGLAADRFDRKRIMRRSYAMVAALSAVLALLTCCSG